jgi:hypothetical protein
LIVLAVPSFLLELHWRDPMPIAVTKRNGGNNVMLVTAFDPLSFSTSAENYIMIIIIAITITIIDKYL